MLDHFKPFLRSRLILIHFDLEYSDLCLELGLYLEHLDDMRLALVSSVTGLLQLSIQIINFFLQVINVFRSLFLWLQFIDVCL